MLIAVVLNTKYRSKIKFQNKQTNSKKRQFVMFGKQKNHTLAVQMPGPNTADIKWINMIIHWASVTSILPNRSVPDTYDCQ